MTPEVATSQQLKKYSPEVRAALIQAAGQLAHADLLMRQQGVDQNAMERSFNAALNVLMNNVPE
jgi:hypothetical protein